jgi:hypothetical protein
MFYASSNSLSRYFFGMEPSKRYCPCPAQASLSVNSLRFAWKLYKGCKIQHLSEDFILRAESSRPLHPNPETLLGAGCRAGRSIEQNGRTSGNEGAAILHTMSDQTDRWA